MVKLQVNKKRTLILHQVFLYFREGCTVEIFKCQQFRVTYTPHRQYENNTSIWDIREHEWANLARTEKTDDEDDEGIIVEDTPLLINLKVSRT